MIDFISVIVPTYNPNVNRIEQTLAALKIQSLDFSNWELIIVDNNSYSPVDIDLSWHPNHSIIVQQKQGLTHARIKGFEKARGNIIIMVDDDNLLKYDFLQHVKDIFIANPELGAVGGKSLPIFETEPPVWIEEFYGNLALRNMGDDIVINAWDNKYPEYAPIGAGMAIRKIALCTYINKINRSSIIISDRKGDSLSSGGDNDIVIEISKAGWLTGYFPQLSLQHIIPAGRMKPDYIARLVNNTNKSWVELLESHNINPWKKITPFTAPLRKFKAWFTYKAWQSKLNYIRWQGACGFFDGLASSLYNKKNDTINR